MKTTWRLYVLCNIFSLLTERHAAHFSQFPSSRTVHPSPRGRRIDGRRLASDSRPFPSQHLALRPYPVGVFSYPPYGGPDLHPDPDDLPDVSVTCHKSHFVVRVKPNFYGLGASASELTLGRSCKSNGLLGPYGDLLFIYPVTACDARLEVTPDHHVYSFVLHYATSSKTIPVINVDVQCWFQRYHHVLGLVVRPTWETPVVHKSLKGRLNDFQIQLMDESWTMPAKMQVYHLGQTLNFEVSASHLPPGGRLYINSCYAMLSTGSELSPTYTIIDNFGCMRESQLGRGTSKFVSPRTDNTLRFSLGAFQFVTDPDAEVVIHCRLFVELKDPSPTRKSCTYYENRWRALTGDDSVCQCCDTQCVTSEYERPVVEGSVSSGPLLVSDDPSAPEGGSQSVSSHQVSMGETGDEDTMTFKTKALDQINKGYRSEVWLHPSDMATYDGEDNQKVASKVSVEENSEENDRAAVAEEEKVDYTTGKIMEAKQKSNIKDLTPSEGDGPESVTTVQNLEDDDGELGSERKFKRERSELREMEMKEEAEPLAQSEVKEDTTKVTGKWAEDKDQPVETQIMEEEKVEKSSRRGEGVEKAEMSEVEGKKDGDLMETGIEGGRDMTWYFKWR